MKNGKPIGFSGLSPDFLIYHLIFFIFSKFPKKIKLTRLIFGELTKLVRTCYPHRSRASGHGGRHVTCPSSAQTNSPKKPRHNIGRERDPLLCSQTESLISRHDGPAGLWREWCCSSSYFK
jgi:hypothetical protein